MDSPLHVCVRCGLVQVLERRSAKEIFTSWKDEEPGGMIYRSARAAVYARHAYVGNMITNIVFPNRPRMLDVGSGKRKHFQKAMGGEQKRGFPVDSYNYMAEDLLNDDYGIVTLNWVLENSGDPNAVLEGCKRALADDGYLVVATGARILVPFRKPLWAYLGKGPADTHPWRFTMNTLTHILGNNGLRVMHKTPELDCEYLVLAAVKGQGDTPTDDADRVIEYFNRWHTETERFYPA